MKVCGNVQKAMCAVSDLGVQISILRRRRSAVCIHELRKYEKSLLIELQLGVGGTMSCSTGESRLAIGRLARYVP